MSDIPAAATTTEGLRAEYERTVAAYVAAGGEESVQRVITALFGLTRRLDVWYHRQLADLGISQGEWAVLSHLAKASGGPLSPGRLADLTGVAASSMTHRLDKMCAAGLVRRSVDETNRTRVQVHLDDAGWRVFDAAVREADLVESDVLSGLTDRQRVELGRLLELAIAGIDALGEPRP
jgi:DNA-binding MarR family transcriptional regulator